LVEMFIFMFECWSHCFLYKKKKLEVVLNMFL
jgi:hypothetical protein